MKPVMQPFPVCAAILSLSLAGGFFTGCSSTTAPSAAGSAAVAANATTGVVVQFFANSNVRNPAANDAFPGVRRVVLRAVDGRARPDAVVQVNDRVSVPRGERTLLFAAEADSGRVTLSELKLQVAPGVDYFVLPAIASDGAILVELRRGAYGEVAGRSAPWSPPAREEATP